MGRKGKTCKRKLNNNLQLKYKNDNQRKINIHTIFKRWRYHYTQNERHIYP